jgi:hypothetical protein
VLAAVASYVRFVELRMSQLQAVTKKKALAYQGASRKGKSRILDEMRAAQSDLDQIAGLRRSSLTVGTFPTLAGSFLPIVRLGCSTRKLLSRKVQSA